jgi:hypothetical protein
MVDAGHIRIARQVIEHAGEATPTNPA